jgi:hypothetical protein
MNSRFGPTLLAVLAAGIAFDVSPASAKRAPPAAVPAVVHEGRRYEAPHFINPCGQNGGCVVARDDATGAQLWALKVYCTKYDSQLETDVQEVFITSLAVEGGRLGVTDEKSRHFAVDLGTRAVSGDSNGCGGGTHGGCSYSRSFASASVIPLLAVLMPFAAISTRRQGLGSTSRCRS